MDRAGFDPRYSPEFQRGFDPAVHEGPSAAAESHERIDSVPTPAVRRIPAAIPGQAPVADDTDSPADTEPGQDDAPVADAPLSPWRNPYLITLSVVGVLLLGGGIGAFRWSLDQIFGGEVYQEGLSSEEMEDAMLGVQLAWGLAPLLALAGVLTLLGVFFFVAWRWRPRVAAVDDESDVVSDANLTG